MRKGKMVAKLTLSGADQFLKASAKAATDGDRDAVLDFIKEHGYDPDTHAVKTAPFGEGVNQSLSGYGIFETIYD